MKGLPHEKIKHEICLQNDTNSAKITITDQSFEAFTAVMSQVEVFWVVTPCSVVVGYQRFRGPKLINSKRVNPVTSRGLMGCDAV
jgi:hypothetical protein